MKQLLHRLRWPLRSATGNTADSWLSLCDQVLLAHLDDEQRHALASLAQRFCASRHIDAAAGFDIDDRMRQRIAIEACLPILYLGLDHYAGVQTVIVYPSGFFVQDEWIDEAGVVHAAERKLAGSASDPGPVVLAWDDVEYPAPGTNIVIHEFAHVLDAVNGATNGFPPIADAALRQLWPEVFSAAFERLSADVDATGKGSIDAYAAENPAEFFAVTTELFFAAPATLEAAFSEVYTLLGRYFRQWPGTGLGG